MTFLIVVERPGDRPRPFSDLTTHRTSALPSAQEVVLISMSENSSTLGHVVFWGFFFMAEPASLKHKHLY